LTGPFFLAYEVWRAPVWLIQLRGVLTFVKIAVFLGLPWFRDQRVASLTVLIVIVTFVAHIVNAIQAVDEYGHVDVTTVTGDEGFVGFEVRDDGPGIPEDFRDKIFRPFATAREGGIGLGLTFVQRVVYEHQGHVQVESVPGHGACFRVELPSERET
jgi:K+-sensing histidine kinase KdpD